MRIVVAWKMCTPRIVSSSALFDLIDFSEIFTLFSRPTFLDPSSQISASFFPRRISKEDPLFGSIVFEKIGLEEEFLIFRMKFAGKERKEQRRSERLIEEKSRERK